MPDSVVAVVPAAGASSRFGSMKLIAPVAGEPMVQRTLRSLFDAGVARVALVLAASQRFGDVPLVNDPRVTSAVNPDPSRGMFSSIQAGLAVVHGDVILVLPADMPFVPPDAIARVAEACAATGDVIVPVHDRRRGHPLAIPQRYQRALVGASSDLDLKTALVGVVGHPPRELDVLEPGILRDVDVPADLRYQP